MVGRKYFNDPDFHPASSRRVLNSHFALQLSETDTQPLAAIYNFLRLSNESPRIGFYFFSSPRLYLAPFPILLLSLASFWLRVALVVWRASQCDHFSSSSGRDVEEKKRYLESGGDAIKPSLALNAVKEWRSIKASMVILRLRLSLTCLSLSFTALVIHRDATTGNCRWHMNVQAIGNSITVGIKGALITPMEWELLCAEWFDRQAANNDVIKL